MTPLEFYQSKKDYAQKQLDRLKRKLTANSIQRLLSFALAIAVLYIFFRNHTTFAIAGSVFFFAVFLVLVRRYIGLQKKRRYFEALREIIEKETDALKFDFRNFNKGDRFINYRHAFSYDLDLFGPGSVFEMLNRTVTTSGEELLAKLLTDDNTDKISILDSQESTKELSKKPDFTLHFRATGKTSEISDEEKEKIKNWCNDSSFIRDKKILKILAYFLPLVTISAIIGAIINPALSPLIIVLYLVNLGVVGFSLRQINKEHSLVSRFLKILNKYHELLDIIDTENFESVELKNTIEKLRIKGNTSGKTLKKLTGLVGAFDNRLNMFAAIFLEGIFLYDFHCLFAIEKWRLAYGRHLPEWLEVVAFFDSKISLSTYAFNRPEAVYPTISESTAIRATQLGHPLIPPTERVNNNFSITAKGGFVIITGANMAGKSTFLRTVGLSLVFAKAGLPVCAENFEFLPLKLFTSMRTSDSLAKHESYFYAELRRLKEILHQLEQREELFIILDEILKGTNSVDKLKGSYLALEKILNYNGTGLIATHDLALTNIADKYQDKIKNQCFEIEIDNAKISFDYKLYDGVTQKMNAMLLMEQMGII